MVRDKKEAAAANLLDCMTRVGSRMWLGRYFTFIIARMGLMLSRDASRQFASVKLRGKAVEAIICRSAMPLHSSIRRFSCSRDGLSRKVYHLGVHYLEKGNY